MHVLERILLVLASKWFGERTVRFYWMAQTRIMIKICKKIWASGKVSSSRYRRKNMSVRRFWEGTDHWRLIYYIRRQWDRLISLNSTGWNWALDFQVSDKNFLHQGILDARKYERYHDQGMKENMSVRRRGQTVGSGWEKVVCLFTTNTPNWMRCALSCFVLQPGTESAACVRVCVCVTYGGRTGDGGTVAQCPWSHTWIPQVVRC